MLGKQENEQKENTRGDACLEGHHTNISDVHF